MSAPGPYRVEPVGDLWLIWGPGVHGFGPFGWKKRADDYADAMNLAHRAGRQSARDGIAAEMRAAAAEAEEFVKSFGPYRDCHQSEQDAIRVANGQRHELLKWAAGIESGKVAASEPSKTTEAR